MVTAVQIRHYEEPSFDRSEILRYAACRQEPSSEMNDVLESCLSEIKGKLSCQVCFCVFPIWHDGEELDLSFMRTSSADLARKLQGSEKIVLFGATVGLGIDRLIARYGHISPAKALFFQAIGAERIESVCNLFCADIQREYAACGYQTGPRFSPGYGDFPLSAQRDIFRVLDCSRKIGLSLNSSLLMSPSKSVTAIIGLSRERICGDRRCCGDCGQENCEFRSKK